jgi:poly(hydroxyalkanoate) granule-associated protein
VPDRVGHRDEEFEDKETLMAAKKTTTRKPARKTRVAAAQPALRSRAQQAARAVRETWQSALEALAEAEGDVEKQVRQLLAQNRIDASDAGTLLKTVNKAITRGRHSAVKELEARVGAVQERIASERDALRRAIDDGVQSTLATFNIPSRKEVSELTHKVDALSRKIDALRKAR